LYDLATDAPERVNLAKTHRQLAERLAALVVEWNRSMPADRGTRQ
jgi:hypothetical protein